MNGSPAIRQRLVGAALRRYREAVGLGLDDAAKVLDCDRSKISRIETGQRGIRSRDLRDLLSEYGIGEHECAVLAGLANPRRASGWWRAYEDVLSGDQRDLVIMESLATRVFTYHAQQVPPLLQTEEYARAVASASRVPAGQRAVEALAARQAAISVAKEPELVVVVGEGALRQQVGGADVMRGQLARLAGLNGFGPRLTVQVLPFACGAHAGFEAGELTVLSFAETPELGIVHIPGISGGLCLEDRENVACYTAAFSRIREAALSPAASAEMLRRLAAG